MTATTASILTFRPPVGDWWRHAGGFVIGPLDGSVLILGCILDVVDMRMTHAEATAWAKALRIVEHRDYRLPTLKEFGLLHEVVIGRLGSRRYWCRDAVRGNREEALTYDAYNGPCPMGRQFNFFAAAVRHHPQ